MPVNSWVILCVDQHRLSRTYFTLSASSGEIQSIDFTTEKLPSFYLLGETPNYMYCLSFLCLSSLFLLVRIRGLESPLQMRERWVYTSSTGTFSAASFSRLLSRLRQVRGEGVGLMESLSVVLARESAASEKDQERAILTPFYPFYSLPTETQRLVLEKPETKF